MRKHASCVVALFSVLAVTAMASGSMITYVTPSGSTAGGNPVSADVTFITSDNLIEVVLQNLQADPRSVGQNLSGLSFTLSTGQDSGTITSSIGTERIVANDGSFTGGGAVSTGWSLSASGGGLELYVLGTDIGPAHTILGPPDSLAYLNANASIAGNRPHNPFLGESATFYLNVPGVTADSTINRATFSFGTTAGVDVPGVQDKVVPEPASLSLLVLGGLAMLKRRK